MAEIQFQTQGVSADSVVNYQGNAALGGGFDSSGLPAGVGADSLANVNHMVRQLNQQQFQWNVMKHKEDVELRNKSLDALNDPGLNIDTDIMDKDREALETQRQDIMNAWKSNPNMMANPQAYVAFKEKVAKFKDMAVSSKSRNLEFKRQMQAIASDNNLENRYTRIKHLDGQVSKGVYHQIDPYFSNPTFDDEKYFKDVPVMKTGNPTFAIGEGGVATASQVEQTPVAAFKAPFSPQALMSNNQQGLQDVQILHQQFANSKFSQDENYLRTINAKLSQINQENGLTEDNPNYFKPIAAKVGDKWQVTDSPSDLAAGLYAYKGYKREVNTNLSKDYQQQLLNYSKEQLAAKKTEAEMSKDKTQEELYKAQTKKTEAEAAAALEKEKASQAELEAPVDAAYSAFEEGMQAAPLPADQMDSKLKEALTSAGLQDGWQVSSLPMDEKYLKMLRSPKTDSKGKAAGTLSPTDMYLIRPAGSDDLSQAKLVGLKKSKGWFSTSYKMQKAVDLSTGVEEMVKSNSGYKADDKTNKSIEAAHRVLKDRMATPAPIRKIAGGKKPVAIEVEGQTYYNIDGAYYDASGNPIKG
jgi:hypothetical protein